MAPIIRESPPSAMAPSSSEEDTSSSDQEMEPQPAKNRPVPVPARQESDDGSGDEEEESDEVGLPGQLGENGMLTKCPLQRPPPSVRGSSDDYEEEPESEESLSEQPSQVEASAPSRKLAEASRPKRKARQERDGDENEVEGGRDAVGSSDEIGENGVVIRRLPRRPPLQRKEGSAEEEESESESESGEVSSMAPAPQSKGNGPSPDLVGTSQLKGNAAATELPKSPPPKEKAPPTELAKSPPAKRKAAAAVELAKSPLPKEKAQPAELAKSPPAKRKAAAAKLPMSPARKKAVAAAEAAKPPPPKKPAAAAAMLVSKSPVAKKEIAKSQDVIAPAGVEGHHGQELKYNAEKHLEEKSESYWYLWQQVLALAAEHPGMSLKKAFLKIPDKKARALDTKVKKQMLAEINQYLRRQGIEKEVVRTLSSLIR
ncbi:hypothetical protein ACP70R_045416 [Stipagrostis hirtigluma subsp. patula]